MLWGICIFFFIISRKCSYMFLNQKMHIDFPVDVNCFWHNLGNVNHLVELKSCTCNLDIPIRHWRHWMENIKRMQLWQREWEFCCFGVSNLKSPTQKWKVLKDHQLVSGIAHALRVLTSKLWVKHLDQSPATHKGFFENVVLLLFGSSMSSKDMAFTGWGKNVWQSVCVLVSWSCRPVSAITTGNDRLFTLKSLQFFIILTISGDARHQTNSSPIHTHTHTPRHWHTRTAVALHSPSGALYSEPCHQMPLRMQNKRLLA